MLHEGRRDLTKRRMNPNTERPKFWNFCLLICSQVSRKAFKYVSDLVLKTMWWLGVYDENKNNDHQHLLDFCCCLAIVTVFYMF